MIVELEQTATIVYEWNWDAIHEMAYSDSGFPILDLNGFHQRKYKYIINEGSSRSSKTYSLIDCYDHYARENEDKRLTVWRDTKTDCKKTVLNDTLKHLKKTGRYDLDCYLHKTESIIYYDTGSSFEIHGTDDEESVHGLTQSAAWLNEPYKMSRDTFDQIDQRTSDFIFIDWNPKKAHWIEDLKKDKRTLLIRSTFLDNPFCPEESRIKLFSYQPVSMCKIVESGLMSAHEALGYDCDNNTTGFHVEHVEELARCQENQRKNTASEYNWSVYGLGLKAEKPNRIFDWEEIAYDEYMALDCKRYYGCDWGVVDPWGLLEAKWYDGALYFHQLNYSSENEIKDRMTNTERTQITGDEEGIVRWIFSRLDIPQDHDVICDNNRPLKILGLREAGWDYALAAIKGPGSILDGIALLLNIKVYYTSTSEDLKHEQENYSRKIDRYGVVMEEPEDNNNHLIDPARYIAQYLVSEGIIRSI